MNIIKIGVVLKCLLVSCALCLSIAHAAGGGHVNPDLLKGHRYGPVRKEDTLWSIALLMHRHHESVHKVMNDLIMDNPGAFTAHGQMLKPGSYLERKSHQKAAKVETISHSVEAKSEAGPDVAGYLHESDPVVRSEMPDNGFSPDIIPFRQALQDPKPLQSGSAGISVAAPVSPVDIATIKPDDPANRHEDVVTNIKDDGPAQHREGVITESDGGIRTSFLSGMLGGCLVMALYILMTRKGVITYTLSRHEPLSQENVEVTGHRQEHMAAATEMPHTFARPRHPDDPVTEPSEQDLLNWSRSLAATQHATRAEEDLSNRLSTSR